MNVTMRETVTEVPIRAKEKRPLVLLGTLFVCFLFCFKSLSQGNQRSKSSTRHGGTNTVHERDLVLHDDARWFLTNFNTTDGNTRIKSSTRVIVVSVWTHYPDMMKIHVASVRAFLSHSNFQYLAVLNSRSRSINDDFAAMANKLKIVYLELDPFDTSDSSLHHGRALNMALHSFFLASHESPLPLRKGDFLWFLDSDTFLVEPTNLEHELHNKKYQIMTMEQRRGAGEEEIRYLWPNFCVFQIPLSHYRELDFLPALEKDSKGQIWSFDSGGGTAAMLKSHPEIKLMGLHAPPCEEKDDAVCQYIQQQTSLEKPSQTCRDPELLASSERLEACRWNRTEICSSHARFYHLGSAASNGKGCSEGFLRNRRRDMLLFLSSRIFSHATNDSRLI